MLLGLLSILPTGNLAINDPTGSICLDLRQAAAIPEDSAWFTPGMIVLIDGVYEEEEESAGKGLGGSSGIGGLIGGRFQGFFIGQPPCEKRRVTLGISGPDGTGPDHTIGGGFGWIDFLGVGSERASGARMRKLEQRILRSQPRQQQLPNSTDDDATTTTTTTTTTTVNNVTVATTTADLPTRTRMILIGELTLDQPRALEALRKILSTYATEPEGRSPMSFVLAGSFTQHAVMAGCSGSGAGGGSGSVEYKEHFDALASVLSDFPTLLQSATFVFVPGDNDGWASAFGAGAAVPLPRAPVPDMFTSRVRRAFVSANAELGGREREREKEKDAGGKSAGGSGSGSGSGSGGGEAIWTTNPARVSVFGPAHEIVVFRDDMAARMRRHAVRLKSSTSQDEGEGEGEEDDAEHSNNKNANHEEDQAAIEADDAMDVDNDDYDDDNDDNNAVKKPPAAAQKANGTLTHDTLTARRLVKTLLDQGYLAPFRDAAARPVLWDRAAALHLYPLPTAMALVDATAPPFCLTYEGCHVMNPGAVLVPGRRGVARWVEYDLGRGGGRGRECLF